MRGALNDDEARRVAKSLVNSPLVKTMVAGADPNVGRLLMAVGKCFDCTIRPANTDAWINGYAVVAAGSGWSSTTTWCAQTLANDVVDLEVSLGVGNGEATRVRLRSHEGLHRGERGVLLELVLSLVRTALSASEPQRAQRSRAFVDTRRTKTSR